MIKIAPSLLSADFLNLNAAVELIHQSEADWFHLDVMDGVFVPNLSFGIPIIKALKKVHKKPLDVHLMIVQPERYIKEFKEAGATYLTVHIEACTHLHRTLQHIKQEGMFAGVALNPHTPVSALECVLQDIDLVCLMSVNPGFGGQNFIQNTFSKIQELVVLRKKTGSQALIEINGGVTLENAKPLKAAGADVLVAGNTVFSSKQPEYIIEQLKRI